MSLNLQYITNVKGETTAIQIPIDDWNAIQKQLAILKKRNSIKADIKATLKEVESHKNRKSKLISLKDFINEL